MNLNTIPFANQTITVFNAYKVLDSFGKPNTAWKATVLKNAMFKRSHKTILLDGVKMSSDIFIAKVPNDDLFICSSDWNRLNDKAKNFTVQSGDVIAFGEFSLDVPLGKTPTYVLSGLTDFFTAKTAQANLLVPGTAHFYWSGE